eukprot:3072326-Pyramimonas_sp.AAC.1
MASSPGLAHMGSSISSGLTFTPARPGPRCRAVCQADRARPAPQQTAPPASGRGCGGQGACSARGKAAQPPATGRGRHGQDSPT